LDGFLLFYEFFGESDDEEVEGEEEEDEEGVLEAGAPDGGSFRAHVREDDVFGFGGPSDYYLGLGVFE
jgi:hypothetical protein